MTNNFVRGMILVVGAWTAAGSLWADELAQAGPAVNRVTMDVYLREDSERCRALRDHLSKLAQQRDGLDVVLHDIDEEPGATRRVHELGRHFKVKDLGLPAVYTMNRFRVGYTDSVQGQRWVEGMLSIEVFTRSTCPHCQQAKAFLRQLAPRWPALRFIDRDIVTDHAARRRLEELTRHYRVHASSVPAFHLCGQLKTGFLGDTITGTELESILRQAARARPPDGGAVKRPLRSSSVLKSKFGGQAYWGSAFSFPLAWSWPGTAAAITQDVAPLENPGAPESDRIDSDPLPEFDRLPELPGDPSVLPATIQDIPSSGQPDSEMEVPFFGRLNAKSLGMPTFTFLVGLVDGFNPCAMWVLMFLLSVLVNIRERAKILTIAGTFVVVSGLAYFAFMAAWLNVFMLIGLDRPAQVILGCMAIVIGLINVKDFFAFGKGVSLGIPDSAKPGLYARVRRIVAAKQLTAALAGAVVLAVLVNLVELLCTAGLPAMYTQILTMQQYSSVVNYMYLGLYIVAYMLDDSLLVAIVVITLSKKKLQEGEGRWLKLLSGVVILALGVVMILKPDWMV